MKAWLSFFLDRPLLVNLVMVLVFLLGMASIADMRYEYNPKVDFGRLHITTTYPGGAPDEIERSITLPIEEELLKVDGLKKLYSQSMESLSLVTVQIHSDVENKQKVINEMQRAVDRAASRMPSDLLEKPLIEEQSTQKTPIIEVHVTGPAAEKVLRQQARKIEEGLREVNGVAGVARVGYRNAEVLILADANKMTRLSIDHRDISQAIAKRNQRDNGGNVGSFNTETNVITVGQFEQPADVADVILRAESPGNHVRLSDVALVSSDYEDWQVRSFIDGEMSIRLQVHKKARADELHTAANVRAYIDSVHTQMPAGVRVKTSNDVSRLTVNMLDVLMGNAMLGLAAVFLLLSYFLRPKFAAWVAVGIPFAVCLSFLLCMALGVTINAMTITGMILVMGILVDDAVVVSENVQRLRADGMGARQASLTGTEQVARPVIFSALTTVLAFSPLLGLGGPAGAFMIDLPIVVCLMLLASLFESQCLLPSHLMHVKQLEPAREDDFFVRLQQRYEAFIHALLSRRYLTTLGFVALFIVVMVIGSMFMKFRFFPEIDIDTVHVKVELPPGTQFEETARQIKILDSEVRAYIDPEDLLDISATVGHHNTDFYGALEGQNDAWGLLAINLKPVSERDTETFDVVQDLQAWATLKTGFDKLEVAAQTDMPIAGLPIEVEVISNSDARYAVSEQIEQFLLTREGALDVRTSHVIGKDRINVELDYGLLAARGLDVEQVILSIRTALDGVIVGEMQTIDERVRFRLQYDEQHAGQLSSLEHLSILNNRGDPVYLNSIADFHLEAAEAAIKHYMGKRTVTVMADIDDNKTTIAEINDEIADFVAEQNWATQYPELRIWQGGELIEQQEGVENFGLVSIICLLGIFAALTLLFNTISQPLLIILCIPFGFIGVVIGFVLQDLHIGMMGLTGVVGLIGVLVNDSLVLVYTLNERAKALGRSLEAQEVAGIARLRFRPIVITSTTTVVGLLPTAYGILGENSYVTPMVMAMAWGVMFGGLVSLLLLPTLYMLEQDLRQKLRQLFARTNE